MLKTRETYKIARTTVARVINMWNPYGLYIADINEEEFDAEIADIIGNIDCIKSPQDASRVVSEVFSKWFSPESFPIVECIQVGQELYLELKKIGLLDEFETEC